MPNFLVEWIVEFSVFCALNYSTIAVATALVSLIMATVLILIRREVLSEESWILYLGLAFGAFVLQYGLRAFASWLRAGNYATPIARVVEVVAQLFFSNLNNLFFLLAALALLYRLPKNWWHSRWRILVLLFLMSAALCAWLPKPFDRYIDATLSAVCLSILSWAMYVSSGTRQRRGWARLNLIGGGGYAALHGIYAYAPNFAQWPRIKTVLNAELAKYGSDPRILPSVEDALDAAIFAIAFAFKLTLFVGALLVIMRCLAAFSPSVSRAVLEPVKTARGEFLASNGIVSAMGQSIGADRAALYLRLPGTAKNTLLALKWASADAQTEYAPPKTLLRPSRNESALGLTLASDDIVWSRDRRKTQELPTDEVSEHDELRSYVNVPLLYHGAAVGALSFDWKRPNGFTATDVQRVRQIADFVTPVVQTERWLRAIADLRERLQHYNFTSAQVESGHFMSRIVQELHDVLSPHGTLIQVDFGFTPQWAIQHAISSRSSDDGHDIQSLLLVNERFHDDLRQLEPAPEFTQTPLKLRDEPIGSLAVAVNLGHDPLVQPTLTQERRQMEAIAVLIKDVIFDLHRKRFSSIVHQLHSTLDARGFASEAHWMRTVREAMAEAGLTEIAIRLSSSRVHRAVPPLVTACIEDLRETVSPAEPTRYRVYAWEPKDGPAQSVIEVPLTASEETLYFAVPRAGFGRELDPDLPWRLFLDRLVVAADSSLVRIRALELESDAMNFEMNDLLVHELKNHGENFRMGLEGIERSLSKKDFRHDDPWLQQNLSEMHASSRRFLDLAKALTPTDMDNKPAVPLSEVHESVARFYEERLAARSIQLEWAVEPDLVINVPLRLAYMVVVSLVQNSRDAIGNRRGKIEVHSERDRDKVLLHVDDDGPGIPEAVRPFIFDLGFSTKGGTGRGLPLVQRTLNRHGGDLTLEQAPAGMSTRFTIHFPKEH